MIKNYIKIAWRNLIKEKLFTVINITGLSIGAAVVILISLFVKNELTFDQFHSDSDRIYRTWVKEHFNGELIWNSVTPLILGPELENNFPEIETVTRYLSQTTLVKEGTFSEQEMVHYVEPSFFEMFDFDIAEGNESQILSGIHNISITDRIAEKYFGDARPIGRTMAIQVDGEWVDFTISHIIEEAPENSSIDFDILLPFQNIYQTFSENAKGCWTCVFGETYIKIKPESSASSLSSKIAPFIDEKVQNSYEAGQYIVGLQPLSDIHLNNDVPEGIVSVSDGKYPYIMASVALLILLLACINFTTLSIGRSVSRAKEVGVRKVTGATIWQLRSQFWSEAILTSGIGITIGVLIAKITLPYFNRVADTDLALTLSLQNIFFCFTLTLIIGLISGIYPSLVLSGFSPIQAIKGVFSGVTNDKHIVLRWLVGFQFVLSIFLITSAIGMKNQLTFLQNKNLGYEKEHTLILNYSGTSQSFSENWTKAKQIKERLKEKLVGKGIKSVLTSSHTFGTPGWGKAGFTDVETDRFLQFNVQQIDYDYLNTMDINISKGRPFNREISSDRSAVIVNQAFADAWNISEIEGSTLPGPFKDYAIIGISDDFHYSSLHSNVEPLVMTVNLLPLLQIAPDLNFVDSPNPKFSFKIESDNLAATIGIIERAWKEQAPEEGFGYVFMDENIDRQYRSEDKLSSIFSVATALAILIACLGLFGIAALTITQRTKEIGVRKILGASTRNIVYILNRNFTVLVALSAVVAAPIAWYFMKEWMADFAYRQEVQWWVFIVGGFIAIAVAFITVSLQSIKAAMTSPIHSLRDQ